MQQQQQRQRPRAGFLESHVRRKALMRWFGGGRLEKCPDAIRITRWPPTLPHGGFGGEGRETCLRVTRPALTLPSNVLDFSRWQDKDDFEGTFERLVKGLKLFYEKR